MNVSEFSGKVIELGFYVKFKTTRTGPIIIIWTRPEGEDYLLPLGHVTEDKTDFFITYRSAWKALDFALQLELMELMKTFSTYKRYNVCLKEGAPCCLYYQFWF